MNQTNGPLLGYREWRVAWDTPEGRPILQSLYTGYYWPESVFRGQEPEEQPEVGQYNYRHGVHAYTKDRHSPSYLSRPPGFLYSELRALGAVALTGKVVIHTDEVVRASYCKILALRLALDDLDEDINIPVRRIDDSTGQLYTTKNARELQHLLLSIYEVPMLPLGEGPWLAPWGWCHA